MLLILWEIGMRVYPVRWLMSFLLQDSGLVFFQYTGVYYKVPCPVIVQLVWGLLALRDLLMHIEILNVVLMVFALYKMGQYWAKNDALEHGIAVSYTHLTLPTTPYV